MHGQDRKKYQHRVVMADMCREFCFYPLDPRSGIPSGMTVEHQDHRRTHNCRANLILLDIHIHNHLSWCSWLNRDRLGLSPSDVILTDDDFVAAEAGVGRRYTREELEEVPW